MKVRKIEFDPSMLGSKVTILTNKNAHLYSMSKFESNKIYEGFLHETVDWLVGCPVFENEHGKLGLYYYCDLIEKADC